MEMYSLVPLEIENLKAILLGWDLAMGARFQGASFPGPSLHPDSPNHFCKVPFVACTYFRYYHMDIKSCHYLAGHAGLATVLVNLDSATQDHVFVAEFLKFHKAQPSRDTLRFNFKVLVETTHEA